MNTLTKRKKIVYVLILIAAVALVAATAFSATFSGAKYVISVGEQGVSITVVSGVGYVYVKDGGSGNFSGSDADNACANLTDAYAAAAALKSSNKVIVVCGALTLTTAENSVSAFNVKATITSFAKDVDYAASNGAKLIVNGATYNLHAVTAFEKIAIEPDTSNHAIYANGNRLVFGTAVTMSNDKISLYGGSSSADVASTEIIMYSGTFGSVYGGGYSGSVTGTAKITAEGATIVTVYGGGYNTGATVDNFDIALKATTVTTVYGGNNQSVAVTNSAVADNTITLSGQSVVKGNLYGGGNKGSINGNLIININDTVFSSTGDSSSVSGDVFAAGSSGSVAGKITVNTNGSYLDNLCGGAYYSSATAAAANVEINVAGGSIAAVCGGSYSGGNVSGNTVVNISGGTVTNAYGGSYSGGNISGNTVVNVSGGTIANVYGGSKSGSTVAGTSTVNVKGGTVTNAYGGGDSAAVSGASTVNVKNGNVTTIYGGGKSGSVASTNVNILGGKIGTIYGGSNTGSITSTSEKALKTFVFGGTVGTIYGGSYNAATGAGSYVYTANCTVTDKIYGAGNSNEVSKTCYVYVAKTTKGASGNTFASGNIKKGSLNWVYHIEVYYEYNPSAFVDYNIFTGLYRWDSPDTPPTAPVM